MLRAFHNDPAIKVFYLARVQAHRVADEIRHGFYWAHGKGCAVGCTLHSNDHSAYERELGIPRALARLEDRLFEALSDPDDQTWPERFLDAIPVGADLALVWPQFFLRLATDSVYGLLKHVQDPKYARQKTAIAKVVGYYKQWVSEEKKPATAAAYAAATAATTAATAAADTATAAATAATAATTAAYTAIDAATTAADTAAYAAADTATAAATAAAAYAAATAATDTAAYKQKSYEIRRWQSLILLELLRSAPAPVR